MPGYTPGHGWSQQTIVLSRRKFTFTYIVKFYLYEIPELPKQVSSQKKIKIVFASGSGHGNWWEVVWNDFSEVRGMFYILMEVKYVYVFIKCTFIICTFIVHKCYPRRKKYWTMVNNIHGDIYNEKANNV